MIRPALSAALAACLAVPMVQHAEAKNTPKPVKPFKNCAAAKKAGYTNIPKTSPYYAKKLDGDHDGVACESVGKKPTTTTITAAGPLCYGWSKPGAPSVNSVMGTDPNTSLLAQDGYGCTDLH